MAIRLSGMASGLDTDTMIKELMSAESLKKDNLVKAQTKLSWKQESWKDMNSKIYNFYSSSLSKMRFTTAYTAKSASIADTSVARVSASNKAVTGNQTLVVKSLAASGYLTGGKIGDANGEALKGTSKLSDVAGMNIPSGGTANINITVAGKSKSIELKGDMTINEFVSSLKSAGVDANFDEKNQRIFVSAKESGASNDFSITADDENGLNALKSLKLYTVNDTEMNSYKSLANLSADEIQAMKDSAFEANKYTAESLLKSYQDKLNSASKSVENLTKANEALDEQIKKLEADKTNDTLTADDKAAIDEKIQKLTEEKNANTTKLDEANATVADMSQYVAKDDDSDSVKADKAAALEQKVNELNSEVRAKQDSIIDNRVKMAKDIVANNGASVDGAVRVVGKDSEIVLNGATFTSNTNNYEINGLTIQATEVSKDGKATTITTGTDVDAIYNSIKDFFKDYNELITSMDKSYNAASSKGYEPLTDDEKAEMSEKDVEKWETKIKDSLLRRDETLGSITNMMKSAMSKGFNIDGMNVSLATFGIKTAGYFGASNNEKGVYHIDGNADDKTSSGNEDKLKAAIANDPQSVVDFFTKLANNLYDGLTKKMSGTSLSSAYTVYNDKKMQKDYDSYKTKISDFEEKLKAIEEKYVKQFSAMESALSKLQSSTSQLQSMLG